MTTSNLFMCSSPLGLRVRAARCSSRWFVLRGGDGRPGLNIMCSPRLVVDEIAAAKRDQPDDEAENQGDGDIRIYGNRLLTCPKLDKVSASQSPEHRAARSGGLSA
jgi:hypothetical protein